MPMKRGVFKKMARTTFTAETMQVMRKSVGPNNYKVNTRWVSPKLIGNYDA